MNGIELRLFAARLQAVCDEMGVALRRAAFSPNIKDRLDFSCAVFAPDGRLLAQAAHIPVHLGSMAFAMRGLVARIDWRHAGAAVLNDPFEGGTHLPDVTVVTPLYDGAPVAGRVRAFVVNRAHHAYIGASEPGSMPISRTLAEEGVVIPPQWLLRDGVVPTAAADVLRKLLTDGGFDATATPLDHPALADLRAQVGANELGKTRLAAVLAGFDAAALTAAFAEYDDYTRRFAERALADLPRGRARFVDWLDDDGQGNRDIPIAVELDITADSIRVDFAGTAAQVEGNVNCPLSVTAAAVYYVFRCLLPAAAPVAAGTFAPIALAAPLGCLVNARPPAAVAAGNVETSMRIVDVLLGAFAQLAPERFVAASQGTMNNVAMGARTAMGRWDYYETIAGGHGAHAAGAGLSARHAHMTNTLNTPIESLETHYPLRLVRYARRSGSGGLGRHGGGDGVEKVYELLAPTRISLLTERRQHAPWGLVGGGAGAVGENLLDGQPLPAKVGIDAPAGARLTLRTPGGGGYGAPR